MGTSSSARIIEYVGMDLKSLEIVYRANGSAVEGLADSNGHRRKVLGEGESVSCGGAPGKIKASECKITKKMFFHSDLLKLCLKKNTTSVSYSLTPLFFMIRKLALQTNEIKI